ncbi:MAG TPA: hypothetical protein VMT53_00485 [Terriglobales bacterium]|nr:hypothetical protein [Terriglobales bacterium]
MRTYANAVAKSLARHAIWEPGADINVGDYGIIRNGCFTRLGSIVDFGLEAPETRETRETSFEFCTGAASSMSGSVKSETLWASGSVGAHWSGGGGVYVGAKKASLCTIHNLWHTTSQVRDSISAWKWTWKLVREVRRVEGALFLLGEERTKAGRIDLQGEVTVGVDAAGSAAAIVATDFALKRYPMTGALFVDLVRVRLLPSGFGANPAPGGDPWEPFPAAVALPDDPE